MHPGEDVGDSIIADCLRCVKDIDDSPMGAAAEKDAFPAFQDQQALLVGEGVRLPVRAQQKGISRRLGEFVRRVIEQSDRVPDLRTPVTEDQPIPILASDPDILQAVFLDRVMFSEGILLYVNLRLAVPFKESLQASAVVVMPVGDDSKVHLCKVNPEEFCIPREKVSLPHVEENPGPAIKFDMQAQAVLRSAGAVADIVDKGSDSHLPVQFLCVFKQFRLEIALFLMC